MKVHPNPEGEDADRLCVYLQKIPKVHVLMISDVWAELYIFFEFF